MIDNNLAFPSKYNMILDINHLVNVPPTICLTEMFFKKAFYDYSYLNNLIDKELYKINISMGSTLNENYNNIQNILSKFKFVDDWFNILINSNNLFNKSKLSTGQFAVRSAANNEDSNKRSFAGLYNSKLNIKGLENLHDAVIDVWKSYFTYQAILERISAGIINSSDRMNVIIQEMIDAKYSGVAFTSDPISNEKKIYIEYVTGMCDKLVSGNEIPRILSEDNISSLPAEEKKKLIEVIKVVKKIKKYYAYDIDVEWVWDKNKLWVVQVRKITTLENIHEINSYSDVPLFEYINLYLCNDDLFEKFYPLEEYIIYFRKKRSPLYQFIKSNSAPIGQALLLRFNKEGINNPDLLEKLNNEFNFPYVILDTNKKIRQQIIEKNELIKHLKILCVEGKKIYKLVIRDFIKGDYGCITTINNSNNFICEISNEGLLALNRGSAKSILLNFDNNNSNNQISKKTINILKDITIKAQSLFGKCQIEWVLFNDKPYAIDYSLLNERNNIIKQDNKKNYKILSHGFTSSKVYKIKNINFLKDYSDSPKISLKDTIVSENQLDGFFLELVKEIKSIKVKPIIVVDRPYIALANLIPYVSGFIFESGSALCHLAILLREHKIPAIAKDDLYNGLNNGSTTTINAV